MTNKLTYQGAGVDADLAARTLSEFARRQKRRPRDPNVVSGIGPFASCYALGPALSEIENPILVTCCDGVGTKAKLAEDWKQIEGLGQDLVAMNVNDLICTGARPLLFLDYYATGKLLPDHLLSVLESIQGACEESGCALVGGETAEMPGVYRDGDFDLAGFAVGIADRKHLLGPERVEIGDRILGLPSSGLHSNGFSLVRKLLEREELDPKAQAPFAKATWRDLLLAPTKLYPKLLAPHFATLNAAAHITGGGLYENLPRVLPETMAARIHATEWHVPPLFQWIQEKANLSTQELLSTFNAGYGMLLIAPASEADRIAHDIRTQGSPVHLLGEIIARAEKSTAVLWE